jgi:hypothetical protein
MTIAGGTNLASCPILWLDKSVLVGPFLQRTEKTRPPLSDLRVGSGALRMYKFQWWLSHFMEEISSWEARSRSACQKIFHLMSNLSLPCSKHSNCSFHFQPVSTLISRFSKLHFNSPSITLMYSRWSVRFRFVFSKSTFVWIYRSSHACYMSHHSHRPQFSVQLNSVVYLRAYSITQRPVVK